MQFLVFLQGRDGLVLERTVNTNISIIRHYYSLYAKIPWSFQGRLHAVYPWVLPSSYRGKHPDGWCDCRYHMDNLWIEL